MGANKRNSGAKTPSPASKKALKTPAKKTPAKPTPAKKSPAPKSPAPKSPAPKQSPPKKSPAKAKVVDPVAEAVSTLQNGLKGNLGRAMPKNVLDMVSNLVVPSLSNPIEKRSDLESKFAGVVGEAISLAKASLELGAAQAKAALDEAEGAAQATAAALESAKAVVAGADAAAKAAKADSEAKSDAKDEAEDALKEHVKAVADLEKTKIKMAEDQQRLQEGLTIIRQPESSAKDGKKIVGVLKWVDASMSIQSGITAALGQTGGFEMMILDEAAKVVTAKAVEVGAALGNWDGHVAKMAARTAELKSKLEDASAVLGATKDAVAEKVASHKASLPAIKAAEKDHSAATKVVGDKNKALETAEGTAEDGDAAAQAYMLLISRTDVVSVDADGDVDMTIPADGL